VQIYFTVADQITGRHQDVVIRGAPTTTVGDVVGAIEGSAATASAWSVGDRRITGSELVTEWLHDGSVLWRGGSGPRQATPGVWARAIALRIVGGPGSGTSWTLGPGSYSIGRADECDISLSGDPQVSRHHAVLTVTDEGVVVADAGSANGVVIGGFRQISSGLAQQEPFQLGESILAWATLDNRDGVVVYDPSGGMVFNRPPRIIDPVEDIRLRYPGEPPDPQKSPFPLIAILAPVVIGVAMALIIGKLYYLAFTALSPVMVIGNYVSTNRRGKKSHRVLKETYDADLALVRNDLVAATDRETRSLRANFPDPATIEDVASAPESRLWERRHANTDFLVLRLGLTDRHASITLDGSPPDEDLARLMLRQVPATVDLPAIGVLGIAGTRMSCEALVRLLVAQACTFHAPDDLIVTVLTGPHQEQAWSWARWLPHGRPEGTPCVARIASSDRSLERMASELASVVDERLASRDQSASDLRDRAAHLVVLDGAYRLGSMPSLTKVLRLGPAVGVYVICVDDSERLLPEECQAAALFSATEPTRLALRTSQSAPVSAVLADLVSPEWAERVARALAPLRLNRRSESTSVLPASLRLLEVLHLEDPDAATVAERWSSGGRTTAAVIGVESRGPLVLDLALDGPHGLVAGTTGSGKSELLQTIIASLALANRPDALTFVLVDYKGGSAFKDCAELPHTVGMVTDLDGHLTERALASLGAELRRRERLLQQTGTKDIEDYWAATDGMDADALPRLVLVIDEFAALAEELPAFVEGLVDLARRGRSLGIHLLLATQRPSGVVSPAIKTNTNLRIAMRVTDAADSTDVIDSPFAARITKSAPGRGYIRIGHEHLTEFQAARVGGRRSVSTATDLEVTPVTWDQLGDPLPNVRSTNVTADETDLSALVAAVRSAGERTGIVAPPSPWLPPLPDQVVLANSSQIDVDPPSAVGIHCVGGHPLGPDDSFCDVCGAEAAPSQYGTPADGLPELAPPPPEFGPLTAIFGLEDRPDIQAQVPACWDVEREAHLLVVGDPGSGRSTFLRTLAGSLADRTMAMDVHLYGIDCGNGALLPLSELPHAGAVVSRTEVDRVDRLIGRLLVEVTRRQEILAVGGFSTISDQRVAVAPDERLPYVVVMIDRWEGFLAEFEAVDAGRLVTSLLHVMKEAPGVGIRVVATGDRSTLSARFSSLVSTTIVLRMNDRANYAMASLNPRKLPEDIRPGQGFRSGSGTELQIALLDRDPSGPAQTAAFRAIAAAAVERHGRVDQQFLPSPIVVLPKRVSINDVSIVTSSNGHAGPLVLAGIGGDRGESQWVDLGEFGPCFLIGGPPRSGRTNALQVIARTLAHQDQRVLVVQGRGTSLGSLVGLNGIVEVVDGRSIGREELTALLRDAAVTAVVVDDADQLGDGPLAELFTQYIRTARDHGHVFVAAGGTQEMAGGFRGFIPEARKSKAGLLLCPGSPTDGELLGTRLPRTAVFPGPPGRAVLATRDALVLVQMPLDDPVAAP
jgi:S-DNA-T family DNA segregation ATPase FtsK/SpoIIIE